MTSSNKPRKYNIAFTFIAFIVLFYFGIMNALSCFEDYQQDRYIEELRFESFSVYLNKHR